MHDTKPVPGWIPERVSCIILVMGNETKTETATRIVHGHSLELNMVIIDRNGRRYRVWRLRPGTTFETVKGTVRDDKGQLHPFTFKCDTPFKVEVP